MISAAIPRASAGIAMAVVGFMAVPANAQSLNGFGLPDRGASPGPPASTVAKRKKLIRTNGADSRSIISDELTAKYGFSLGMSMQQLYVQGGWNAPSSSGLNTLGLRPPDQPNISLLFDGPGSKGHLRAATVITTFEAPAGTVSAPCDAEFAALKNIAEKATLAEKPRGGVLCDDGKATSRNYWR